MVNRTRHVPENTTKNYKGNACGLLLKGLRWNVYDFVREDERFRKVTAELEKYAAGSGGAGFAE